jgi:hypothetical protein
LFVHKEDTLCVENAVAESENFMTFQLEVYAKTIIPSKQRKEYRGL